MNSSTQGRDTVIGAFLEQAGWEKAERSNLAGDASFRRYERLVLDGRPAVLMDAPPPQEGVRPFISRTEWLRAQGCSAPEILAADEQQGLLLLEDLGDDLYGRVLERKEAGEEAIYHAAMEVLAKLYDAGVPAIADIEPHRPEKMLQESALFCEWFLPHVIGEQASRDALEEFEALWGEACKQVVPQQHCFVHWDYHAENLLWLPQRDGIARVGLIDYQDGMVGDAAFDVVSLLEDARRDVPQNVVESSLDYYLSLTGQERENFMARYALLGAQRNLKIIGIFVRLCVRDGKPHYLQFQPRVWAHLERDLSHPALASLRAFVDRLVPSEFRGVTSLRDDVRQAS